MPEVFVIHDNETQVYHTNEDCQALQQASGYRRVPQSVVDGTHRECRYGDCAGSDDKANVYDAACPMCGTEIPKNKFRNHLPCDGTPEPEVPDP